MTATDLRARLAEIKARADAATDGPWEVGDRLHVQGESRCDCHPRRGPLVRREVMDINGEQMMAHVHRQEEAWWPHGIYAKDGEVIVNDTEEYGYMDDLDAEFIAHARTDVPAMSAALTAVLDELDRLENKNVQKSLALGEADPGRSTFSDGHQIGIHKGRIEATARIHEVITDALSDQP